MSQFKHRRSLVSIACSLLVIGTTLLSGMGQQTALAGNRDGAHAKSKWRRTVADDGSFRVALPGKGAWSVRKTETGVGSINLHVNSTEDNAAVFIVIYADLPGLVSNRDAAVAGVVGGLASSGGRKIVKESRFNVAGSPGRRVKFEGPIHEVPMVGEAKVWMKGNRLYQQVVMGPKGDVSHADVNVFFSSFRSL